MDFKTITTEGKLVYASRPGDKNFRLWRTDKTACYVTYYQTLELTKLDKVILMTLKLGILNTGLLLEHRSRICLKTGPVRFAASGRKISRRLKHASGKTADK